MKSLALIALQLALFLAVPVFGETFLAPDELPVQAELPDPLIDLAGHKVETPAQWEKRRGEMKRVLEYYAIGTMPPAPRNVKGQVTSTTKIMNDQVRSEFVHLSFGPDMKLGLNLLLLFPKKFETVGSVRSVIVIPSFKELPETGGLADFAKPFESALNRGYAVATFFYQDCAGDKNDGVRSGFLAAYPENDWGTLAAWAWGMSRCVDWLERQDFLKKAKWIAVGHSRLGKAALIAGAFDERFALTAAAGSGCAGTGAYRFCGKGRGGKEGLEDAVGHFPQWFGPRLAGFSGKVERLPFDQNWFIALIAPRCFIAADAESDPYTNGVALDQSIEGAMPVFKLLGVPDHLAVHLRPGGHELAAADWTAILDFSDHQLKE